jgi:hypothetical protein
MPSSFSNNNLENRHSEPPLKGGVESYQDLTRHAEFILASPDPETSSG